MSIQIYKIGYEHRHNSHFKQTNCLTMGSYVHKNGTSVVELIVVDGNSLPSRQRVRCDFVTIVK